MIFSKWRSWAHVILWVHIGALIANALVYGFITVTMDVPFDDIFNHPESAPYYLTVYGFVLVFCLSLCALGLVFGDIFGHKDLRAQMVSRGMFVIGVLAALLPIALITTWDLALNQLGDFAAAAQHFGIWITLVTTVIYAGLMVLIFFLGSEHASIPKGWAWLSLFLACVGVVIAISCFWISEEVLFFRIVYLLGSVAYLVWAVWLTALVKRVERLP